MKWFLSFFWVKMAGNDASDLDSSFLTVIDNQLTGRSGAFDYRVCIASAFYVGWRIGTEVSGEPG